MARNTILKALFTAALILVASCANTRMANFDVRHVIENEDKTIAFVGRKIGIREFDPSRDDPVSDDPDEIIIYMDSAYEARYEILELVHGEYQSRIIDFEAYDHYGFPPFAKSDVALIYLVEDGGRLYHDKYQWDKVYRTKSGRYAACGDPYFWLDEEDLAEVERQPLTEVTFAPAVTVNIVDELKAASDPDLFSLEEIAANREKIETYYAAPVFEVRRGIAKCKMGAYPDELYRIQYETVIRPRTRLEECESKVGYDDDDWQNEEIKAALDACIDYERSKHSPR